MTAALMANVNLFLTRFGDLYVDTVTAVVAVVGKGGETDRGNVWSTTSDDTLLIRPLVRWKSVRCYPSI